MSDYQDNTNILTVIWISLVLELDHNLLSTILLVKKYVEVFLKKVDQLSKIIVEKKVFSLTN